LVYLTTVLIPDTCQQYCGPRDGFIRIKIR